MLNYNGYLKFDNPLSNEELQFLKNWQKEMHTAFKEYENNNDNAFSYIEKILGVYFDDAQKWTLHFTFNPMISFDNDGIILSGQSKKGQLRESILAYKHFFIGENAVLKKCLENSDIFKPHSFSGIIEATKTKHGNTTEWCYIAEDGEISSVDAHSKEEYLNNTANYPKTYKEDTCQDKLDKYFPPIYSFLQIKEAAYKASGERDEQVKEKRKKI